MKGDYFQINYQYANEQRDYVHYPLHGHYLHFELKKNFGGSSPVNHFELIGKSGKTHGNKQSTFYRLQF